MWAGTEATYALAEQLIFRDRPLPWYVNRGSLWDMILNGRADLIFYNGETYEVKSNVCLQDTACLAEAKTQLQGYIGSSAGKLHLGTDYTAFRGAAGIFGYGKVMTVDVTYWFEPSGTPGLIGYDIRDRRSVLSSIWSVYGQRRTSPSGALPFFSPIPVFP